MFNANTPNKLPSIRVLIVDDTEDVRDVLGSIFKFEPGFVVVGEAANGEDGVKLALAERPDLIIMDYAMPRMDGIETTIEILRKLPRTTIVVLSAFDTPTHRLAAFRAGAKAFFVKPVRDLPTFYSEMRRLVGMDAPAAAT